MALPRILVIDDQYGRCGLGKAFEDRIGPEAFRAIKSDRRALCSNYGLVDITGDVRMEAPDDPLARAVFCPAQVWNPATGRIEQAPQMALDMVAKGWPFPDGERWSLILLDLRFSFGALNVFGDPEGGSLLGLEVLLPSLVAQFGHDLPIVVLSSTQRGENNAKARTLGALDFIQRLPGPGAPPEACRRALQEALFQHALVPDHLGLVIGRSLPVLKMLRSARRAARSARTVLLQGETGTGKGLLARYIHAMSERRAAPFESFNGSQRPGDLQADELFGHWKGAFTDAKDDQPGIWERADGGTVFIDEVADLDPAVQRRLMEPIDERRVRRLGHPAKGIESDRKVDVLVLLATNRNLYTQRTTQVDFLNRIHAFEILVPPLRERREDIPALAQHLTHQINGQWQGRLLPEALDALQAHDWEHGNIRELRNWLERALTAQPGQDITVRDFSLTSEFPKPEAPSDFDGSLMVLARFVTDLESTPDQWRQTDVTRWQSEYSGVLVDLVAKALLWGIAVNQERGGTNFTALARLLSGRDSMTTMEAKRFLGRLLALDRPIGEIWRKVKASARPSDVAFLEKLRSKRIQAATDRDENS